MWAHYADLSKGIVLRFRNADEHSLWSEARPVEYVDVPPVVFTNDEIVEHILAITKIDGSGQFHKLMYTKARSWEAEQEWRIAWSGRDPREDVKDLPFGLPELDGVIFGLHTSDNDKVEIREMAKRYPNVEFMQITQTRTSFDLNIHRC